MRQVSTSTLSNQNIATALLVNTYTADADRLLFIRVCVDQVAGNGSYSAYATLQELGTGSAYQIQPITTATVASGVTAIAFATIALPVKNTDVVKVYVLGLAGDTTTPDIITRILEDDSLRPTTADRTLDVSSGGEAGLDWANVGSPSTTVSLSATTVATVTTTATATAVTTVNGLAAGVITAASIAADAITAAKVADGTIDAATFAAGAINAAAIAADAITDAKVAADVTIASVTGAVGSVTAAVTVGTINAGVITATSIATDAITAAKIAADAIGASELAADAVAEIQNGLATPTNITAGTIANVTTVNGLAAGVITAASIAADAITAAKIATNAIDADALATDAVSEIVAAMTAPDNTTISNIYSRIGAPVGASISADIAGVQSDTDDLQTRIGTAGAGLTALATATNLATANTNISAINTKLGTPAGASVSVDIAAVKTDTAAIGAKTTNLPTDPASTSALATAHGSGSWATATGFATPSDVTSARAAILALLPAALSGGKMDSAISQLDATAFSVALLNLIADHVRVRGAANTKASGLTVEKYSEYDLIQSLLKGTQSGSTLTPHHADGTALDFTHTLITDPSGVPVVGMS